MNIYGINFDMFKGPFLFMDKMIHAESRMQDVDYIHFKNIANSNEEKPKILTNITGCLWYRRILHRLSFPIYLPYAKIISKLRNEMWMEAS